MLYRILHKTTYDYTDPVSLCHNLAHLTPRSNDRQECRLNRLQIDPAPAVVSSQTDYFGNQATFFSVHSPHRCLEITASHLVEVQADADVKSDATPWEEVRERLRHERSAEWLEASEFVHDSPLVGRDDAFAAYAAKSFTPGRPLLEALTDLNGRIHHDFGYDPKSTTVATPIRQVFEQRRGVCQDFAHFGIACLRSLGLAARYISGYISTVPPPGKEKMLGADATHAWLTAFTSQGWVDIDPTNNVTPGQQHVLLAWGRDYDDVSPVKGVILGGGTHTVKVAVDVMPT